MNLKTETERHTRPNLLSPIECEEIREFVKLTPTEKFRLLMHALEFLRAMDASKNCSKPVTED